MSGYAPPSKAARPAVGEVRVTLRRSTMTLSRDAKSVAHARQFIKDACRDHGLTGDPCDTAVLLTSETVTNALLHGRSEARLSFSFLGSSLRVEVWDENSRHPERVPASEDALSGRGLGIVEMLASRWGVRDEPYGKTVWFELEL